MNGPLEELEVKLMDIGQLIVLLDEMHTEACDLMEMAYQVERERETTILSEPSAADGSTASPSPSADPCPTA